MSHTRILSSSLSETKTKKYADKQNVAIEGLTIMLHIWKTMDSTLGLEAFYPDLVLVVLSIPQSESHNSTLN
jgi:hypothetical protein